ncbi:MAG TPA: transcriptional repressor [Terriglobales bacterium]|nr:transcriptional repressor [Terriglobales bacterium]
MPLPQTESPGALLGELVRRGVRMTRQRRAILAVIETAQKHLDASQLLRRARRLNPNVDRVTVYRTLGLLKRHGLIDELDLMHVKGEGHYYERKIGRDHLHMTCLRCGAVAEFESTLFRKLTRSVETECGFHVVVARLEIGGYCSQCRK